MDNGEGCLKAHGGDGGGLFGAWGRVGLIRVVKWGVEQVVVLLI